VTPVEHTDARKIHTMKEVGGTTMQDKEEYKTYQNESRQPNR
jgi:hypothetical protein